jgi:hypothetical protein
VSLDNILPFVIVAVVVISSIASGLRQAKRGFDAVVEKQRAAEPERLAALEARLKSQGITPSPALQRLISTLGADATVAQTPQQAASPVQPAYAPQAAYVPQPAYAPQAAYAPAQQPTIVRHVRHRQQQAPPPAPQPPAPDVTRAPVPFARSVDVPDFTTAPAAAAVPGARRTLAEAFGDPAHARTAVILTEILGPPVALR